MTLLQANLYISRDKSALCTKKLSLKILFQVNLRLRACLAICLKYGKSQPKCAYKARAYKKKKCILQSALHHKYHDYDLHQNCLIHDNYLTERC